VTDELDWLPAGAETAVTTRTSKHRHVYDVDLLGGDPHSCRCGAIQDPAASRRGRTVRSYGNRAELSVARTYGGRKVGHAQGPTDVVGKTRKVQVKTTRRAVPAMWRNEFAKLESERDGRLAILLLRFVQAGNLGPDDYIVIRGRDFLEWYGADEP
jgi:hypothetical protein